MSDKSFPDPDAIIIEESDETIKLVTWNLWWKFESYKKRENLYAYVFEYQHIFCTMVTIIRMFQLFIFMTIYIVIEMLY